MKSKNHILLMTTRATPVDRPMMGRFALQAGALAILLSQQMAHAGNTWDGGGGDDNWGTGANWSPDGSPAPGSGNDIFFGGSTRLSPFNNYTAFDDWRNIIFNVGAGSFNLFGNAIDLFGKIENLSSNTQTVSLTSIALNSATANEFNPVNGNLTILSTNIFTNGNQLKVFGNNGFTLSFGSGTNIQQAGSLSINQNSTVIFNSAHSYSGDTLINAGKLQFASGGSAANTTIRIGDTSGTVGAEFNLTAASGGQSLANTIVSRLGGAGYAARIIDSQNTSGTNTLTGVIALDAALTIKQAAGGTLNLTGSFFDVKQQVLTVISEGAVDISKPLNSSSAAGGSLIKQGNGTLTLSNSTNNYTGTNPATLNASGTQIAAGTLAIAADTSFGLAPAGAYNNIQFTGSGTLRANANIGLHANRNISIASGATASFDSSGNTFTINGIVNGSGGKVEKSGNGTVILTGTNTYGGTTAVTTGTLLINGNNSGANGAVSVAAAATLGGNGTIGGATTFTGASIHAPGSAAAIVGTQAFSSTLAYGSGTVFNWDLDVTSSSASTYDKVTAAGAITGGAAVFKIVLAAGDSFTDAFWDSTKTWTDIYGGAGAAGINLAAIFSGFDASGGVTSTGLVSGQGQFTLSNVSNTLTWTAVPEPSSALAGLLLGAGLLRRRRA